MDSFEALLRVADVSSTYMCCATQLCNNQYTSFVFLEVVFPQCMGHEYRPCGGVTVRRTQTPYVSSAAPPLAVVEHRLPITEDVVILNMGAMYPNIAWTVVSDSPQCLLRHVAPLTPQPFGGWQAPPVLSLCSAGQAGGALAPQHTALLPVLGCFGSTELRQDAPPCKATGQ